MVKEVKFKISDKTHDIEFGSFKAVDKIRSHIEARAGIYEAASFYNNQLDELGVLTLKKSRGFKHADFIHFDLFIYIVSAKFKEVFDGKLKGFWHKTSEKDYFAFVQNNCIDMLDKSKTTITYYDSPKFMPCRYKSIENETFKPEAEDEYLFSIIEDPLRVLCTSKFEELLKQHQLTGIQVYKDINFKRNDRDDYDVFRNAKYNDEGDRIPSSVRPE